MPLEIVTECPQQDQFTPLSEHQEQTPSVFFGAKPVLHHHAAGVKLAVRRSEFGQSEALQQLDPSPGDATEDLILETDVWVTSKNVILYSSKASKGVSVDYPTIALHALGSQDGEAAVYLQLDLHDKDLTNDDEDIQTLTLHLIPGAEPRTESNGDANGHADGRHATNGALPANSSAAKALFEALSACADLNPDPADEDEEDDGSGMPEPGAGGWITSDNMHEFMDESGNWIGPEVPVLGAGAGQVRSRDAVDDEEEDPGDEHDETKWRRTS
ncbi:uncharacterized protein PV09_02164 [Verruconis gallopava]|uniref:Protein LOT5 n=1 Tax=Verruconis gallopava TaxID=253628 RepID=A0A0D2B7U8_9PEZI|nr:uncharacterized protein PV09_02164 [Verruconis gallopava]KIW07314.1 hypothetical protein PV09_02164 [Verruconis gallopava]